MKNLPEFDEQLEQSLTALVDNAAIAFVNGSNVFIVCDATSNKAINTMFQNNISISSSLIAVHSLAMQSNFLMTYSK